MSSDKPVVLLVDDEPNILNALRRVLRREGYEIVTATSGPGALTLVSGGQTEISVVVSDFKMPEMDGVELLGRIRQVSPDTVRIILSGYADADLIQSAINEGQVFRFVSKPWDDDELRVMIRQSLERHHSIKNARGAIQQLSDLREEVERAVQEGLGQFSEIADDETEVEDEQLDWGEAAPSHQISRSGVWQEIVNLMPVAVIGLDPLGMVVLANPWVEKLWEVPRSALLGCFAQDVLPQELVEFVEPMLSGEEPMRRVGWLGARGRIRVQSMPMLGVESELRGILIFGQQLQSEQDDGIV